MAPDDPTSSSLRLASDARELPNPGLASGRRGLVVAVYGARRQVGVSTVASSLALAFVGVRAGEVALAELDPRVVRARARADQRAAASTSARANGRQGGGSGPGRVALPGLEAWMARRADAVWTLERPARARTATSVDAKSVEATLDALRATFPVIVIELEHQVNERTLAALDAANRILIVTAGSVPSLRATQRVLRLCKRLNYPDEKLCVVVNRFDAPGALPTTDVSAVLKRELCWRIPEGLPMDLTGLAEKLDAKRG